MESFKKKILLVTRPLAPPWDEASKNFAYNLAKKLSSEKKTELHLMTKGVLSELPENIIQENIYTASQNDFTFFQKLRSFWFQWKKKKYFTVIHYFFTPTKLNIFLIKNLLKSSRVKTIQTIATLREDIFSIDELKQLIFADLVITYSDYAKNKLNSLGFKNIKRVYPGIDLNYYFPTLKNQDLIKKFHLNSNDFIFSYPGEYYRLGATDNIIEALPKIFEKIPNGKFIFACRIKNKQDAKKKEEAITKLKEYNILDKVVFSDTFSDMAKLYNISDLVIFPVGNMQGKFDVPLVVIEAMACAKAVIISDIPILKEFSNEKNSVQIEAGNIKELTQSILNLYNNPKKRNELGLSSRIYVERNFDIKNVAIQYAKIYSHL